MEQRYFISYFDAGEYTYAWLEDEQDVKDFIRTRQILEIHIEEIFFIPHVVDEKKTF